MHIVLGSNPENSERVSDKYLQINSVGRTLEELRDAEFNYPNGRVDYCIKYYIQGSDSYDFGDGIQEIQAGTALVIKPGVPYNSKMRRESNADHWWIHFCGSAVEGILKELGLEDKRYIQTGIHQEIIDIFEDIYRELLYRAPGYESAVNAEIIHLLTEIARKSDCLFKIHPREECTVIGTMWDTRIMAAIQEIHINNEQYFSTEQLAEICHLSKYHFCRLFQQTVGQTPHQYMLDVKIDKAKKMLLQTDMSVGDIAEALGFNDVTVFRRAFIRNMGCVPSDFRKKEQQDLHHGKAKWML